MLVTGSLCLDSAYGFTDGHLLRPSILFFFYAPVSVVVFRLLIAAAAAATKPVSPPCVFFSHSSSVVLVVMVSYDGRFFASQCSIIGGLSMEILVFVHYVHTNM